MTRSSALTLRGVRPVTAVVSVSRKDGRICLLVVFFLFLRRCFFLWWASPVRFFSGTPRALLDAE